MQISIGWKGSSVLGIMSTSKWGKGRVPWSLEVVPSCQLDTVVHLKCLKEYILLHIDFHFLLEVELIMFFMFLFLRNIYMTLTMDKLGCDSGGTRGRVPNWTNAHPWQEGHNAPKPGHRLGKGAMGALRTWRGYVATGGCHVIGTSIFVQFYGTMRWYQCGILFKFCKALRTVLLKGEGNLTPRFWPYLY